jgi:TonB family protein
MKRVLALALLIAACAAPPPTPTPIPPPAPSPSPSSQPAAADERAIGSGRVNASLLNVRREPSLQGEVVGHARRGERVTILGESGEWLRVRTGGGEVGWVSSQHVARDGAATTTSRRGGCPPDSDYRFLAPPRPSFNENGPHGVVTIEASVNAQGTVTSAKVISNTTGAEALAVIAAREITAAKFAPPVRNCVARAFLFTYRRAF